MRDVVVHDLTSVHSAGFRHIFYALFVKNVGISYSVLNLPAICLLLW